MEGDKEIQELCELKMLKALLGFSVGRLPGRSEAGEGKEGKKDEGAVRRVENEVMNAILTAGPIESTTRGDIAAVVEERRNADRSSGGDVVGEPLQHVDQSWDCSQKEDESEERCAMDWRMDDEMMRQREEVCKEEEKVVMVQNAPELVVVQVLLSKGSKANAEEKKKKKKKKKEREREGSRFVRKKVGGSCEQTRI